MYPQNIFVPEIEPNTLSGALNLPHSLHQRCFTNRKEKNLEESPKKQSESLKEEVLREDVINYRGNGLRDQLNILACRGISRGNNNVISFGSINCPGSQV